MFHRFLTPLAAATLFSACQPSMPSPPDASDSQGPPTEPAASTASTMPEPDFADLRWPLSEPPAAAEKAQWPQWEALRQLASGDAQARASAIAALKASTASVADWDAEAIITPAGVPPTAAGEKVARLRQDAFENALLWRLTGEAPHGDRARMLLLRFAAVFRQWPCYFDDASFPVTDSKYRARWDARALWGRWYPLDLPGSAPLLRTYDLIRSNLTEAEKAHIVDDLFAYQKTVIDGFDGTGASHNMIGYHLVGLIRFGLVLERPDWIHEAVRLWREALLRGYTPDGVYREVTIDYHSQLTQRLVKTIPDLLAGYSDPPGWQEPDTGARFDRLDLHSRYDSIITRLRDAIALLAKPDGVYLNTNDSWPGRSRLQPGQSIPGAGLLGAAGVAKLAVGEMALFLKYHGIRGHDHRDALNLSWYANGREVFSETAYRPEGREFARRWSASTASHYTVAIDGGLHFEKHEEIPARLNTFTAQPPPNPGPETVRAAFAGASRFEDQGRLLVWNATSTVAQAVEVEQPGAYPSKATLFRRTAVLVPYDARSGYLVEFFRVEGGTQHDYFLRGSLDEPYRWETTLPNLESASGTEYDFITLKQKGAVSAPFTATALYGDGTQTRSMLAALPSSDGSPTEYLIGSAPAIRRADECPFTLLRHRPADGSSVFAWVHESTPGPSRIERVELHREGRALALTIHRADGATDTVLSTMADGETVARNGWTLKGRLAWGSDRGGVRLGVLLSGERLSGGDEERRATSPVRGTLIATTDGLDDSRGTEPTARLRLGEDAPLPDVASLRLAHFDRTPKTRVSIPIRAARLEGRDVVLTLAHPTGFEATAWGTLSTTYPGWRIRGACHVVLE